MKCKYENCNIIPCFGYINDKNLYCLEHRKEDMIFTFEKNDLNKIDTFDVTKTYRQCFFKNCIKEASCNFIDESRRILCAEHKLDMMVNLLTKKCICNSGKYRIYNIPGRKEPIACEDCKTNDMINVNISKLNKLEKYCPICYKLKNIQDFGINFETCKNCMYIKRSNYINNNIDAFLKNLWYHVKNNAKNRLNNGRLDAGTFEITFNDLKELYTKQNGLCFYSQYPMNLSMLTDFACSLERLDPSQGYIKNNIALVIAELNSVSQWNKEKYSEFIRMIFIRYDKQVINFDTSKNSKKKRTNIYRTFIDGIEHVICNICKKSKSIDKFNKKLSKGCKECKKNYNKIYGTTARGHLIKLLSNCRARSKKDIRFTKTKFDLSIDDFIELFNKQNGLCAYSGIPMTFGSRFDKNWICSIERINPLLGYIKTNICFIIHELNTTDYTSIAINKDSITGSSAWSKSKIELLKNNYIKINKN